MRAEAVRVRSLLRVEQEISEVWTLYFNDELCSRASPGQYAMIWAPGVDEVPMSLSTISRDRLSSVTVRSVGEATKALCGYKAGDKVGVRGPFGNGFTILGTAPLVVGGGTGAASLISLVEMMKGKGIEPTFILGAQNIDRLLFKNRLERLLGELMIPATEDGSYGFRGLASECASMMLEDDRFDGVYMCGPEKMMASIFAATEQKSIPVQASLERYIKCAVGLCGSCSIGPYRVCKDGPVFTSKQLRTLIGEFGIRRMDHSGRMVKIDH